MVNLHKVLEFACKAHEDQTRKDDSIPFVCHPISVMTQLHKLGVTDSVILAAALLHDVVEDTVYTVKDIGDSLAGHATFDEIFKIVELVMELTLPLNSQTKQMYMESFANKSREALLIKVVDRLDNVNDYAIHNLAYAKKYFDKAAPLYTTFRARREEILAYAFDELDQEISSWERQ